MTSILKNKIVRKIGKGVLVTAFWLLVWQAVSMTVHNDLLVASPLQVALRLQTLAAEASFWYSVALSFLRILLGFLLGVIAGTLFALLTSFRFTHSLFSPLRVLIQATPVASFIMLAWIWLRRDQIPVFIAMLIVIPVFWSNVRTGIQSVGKKDLDMAKAYRFSRIMKVKHLFLPKILPHFASAATVSIGLVWKAGIAAEVLCQPKTAIGTQLFQAKTLLETTDVFAWTTVVVVISLLLEYMIRYLLERWKKTWNA